jgi:hypothetical protein
MMGFRWAFPRMLTIIQKGANTSGHFEVDSLAEKFMKLRLFLVLLVVVPAFAFASQPRKSTPKERERALVVINKLEKSPMDPSLKIDRDWVFQWVKSSDVDARVCSAIIKPLTDQSPTPFRNALMLQNILSSAKFALEHPGSNDRIAMYKASTEGMIRAYRNLVKQDPSRKNEFMESLIAKQQTGELISYVRKGASECSKHPATVLEP